LIKIPDHGRLLDEHILNALVVDGRRLGSARRFIVAHDEIPTYGVYGSHIPELTVTVRLREKLVFYGYEAGRIASEPFQNTRIVEMPFTDYVNQSPGQHGTATR